MFLGMCILEKNVCCLELLDLDMREGLQVLTTADKARKIEIKAKIESLASLEEILRGKNKGLCS